MRSRCLTCVLVLVALGFGAVASADMVVYDDFSGTSLDTSKWGAYEAGPWPTVSGGNLNMAGSSGWTELGSKGTFDASANTFEWKYMGGAGTQYFGIYFNNYATGYVVENTGAGGAWRLENNGGVFGDTFSLAAGDTVRLVKNGSNFDASVNGGAVVSSVAVNPSNTGPANFWFGLLGSGSASFDYVSVGTPVPEPSTLGLLSAGVIGLLAYAWKKHR